MEKICRPPFRKGHIVTVAQGLFDGLAPGQALARKMLFLGVDQTSWVEVTDFVRKIGPDVSVEFLQLDPKDLHTAYLEMVFVTGEAAIQSHYPN